MRAYFWASWSDSQFLDQAVAWCARPIAQEQNVIAEISCIYGYNSRRWIATFETMEARGWVLRRKSIEVHTDAGTAPNVRQSKRRPKSVRCRYLHLER